MVVHLLSTVVRRLNNLICNGKQLGRKKTKGQVSVQKNGMMFTVKFVWKKGLFIQRISQGK